MGREPQKNEVLYIPFLNRSTRPSCLLLQSSNRYQRRQPFAGTCGCMVCAAFASTKIGATRSLLRSSGDILGTSPGFLCGYGSRGYDRCCCFLLYVVDNRTRQPLGVSSSSTQRGVLINICLSQSVCPG